MLLLVVGIMIARQYTLRAKLLTAFLFIVLLSLGLLAALDSYLIWSISDGGKAFGTEMPAYKRRLSENQIWQIITFMRSGFGAGD